MGQIAVFTDERKGRAHSARRFSVIRGWLLFLILSLGGGAVSAHPAQSENALSIPTQSDWTDYGMIVESGALGEWDYQLWGGFTGTAVKKDETYYLYYQGASGYQTTPSEVVTWRSIGVATSPDGVNFTKASSNPVITWFPNNETVEGASSGAAALDSSGEVVVYYGANTAQGAPNIYADGRLAASSDGLGFTDQGIALNHGNASVWGYGDQLYPIIAFYDAGRWFVYYIPWGTPQEGLLGAAWGSAPSSLGNSSAATSGGEAIQVRGMGSSARIGPETYALFLSAENRRQIEVRTVSLSAPNQLSAPVQTYQFDEVAQATVLLDEETNTWFMYYRGDNKYGVKLAPAGQPDATPPTAPVSVTATPVSNQQINLSWGPATDSDTGIVQYMVYRDGVYVATVRGLSYSDIGLIEQTTYSYTVSAINFHGIEGPRSAPVTATTLVDITPPHIVSANASGASNRLTMVFDEPVERASAEAITNYTMDQDISVLGVTLQPDLRTVVLTTSEQEHLTTYPITISGVRDRATSPSPVAPGTAISYTHTRAPGLVGAWMFDEGEGPTAFDTGNYRNDGALVYTAAAGPTWVAGKSGGALDFDGVDDQVTIAGDGALENVTDASHTFTAWVRPDTLPPNATLNDAAYTVLVRNRTGLTYDHSGRFRAQIRLASGSTVAVSSGVLAPGSWHHLAMVVDDTSKRLHLYVDGQEVSGSPVTYTGLLADHTQAPYYVGTSDTLTGRYELRFSGEIDEAQIYYRALSQTETRSLYTGSPIYYVCLPLVTRSR